MAPLFLTLWQWRKVVLYTALVAAVALMGWRVSVWHNAYERIGAVESALEAERLCDSGSACSARQAALEAAQAETTAKVVATYEAELASVRARKPVSIRVCDRGGVQNAGTPGAAHAGTATGGVLPGSAERDIGPALSALALEADEIVAACRSLQQWNAALAR